MVTDAGVRTRRPFRIAVAGHGSLPEALVGTAGSIVGTTSGVVALRLDADESPETFASRVTDELAKEPDPVLVLTDLVGGSPHNVVTTRAAGGRARCVGGANLAILLEAMTSSEPLDDRLVERLVRLGRDAVAAVPARD
ncbi:MAG: PTS mannose transporter subunit IIAB [Chloroflexota bacterium]|nr:PTS mannose transporter subunit IIAB [Chloroflexota bacterium]